MSGLSFESLIRRVDLLTLRLFLVAIDERQLGRAAALENIAPSAATKRIQDLEQVLGVELLERTPKGVQPSRAGEVLATHVRRLFADMDLMRRDLGEFTGRVQGHLRVAVPVSILVFNMARELGEFCRSFPFVDVQILEDLNPAVVRAVRMGHADLAVFAQAPEVDVAGLVTIPYRADRIVALHPLNHSFSQRTSVTIHDLLEERLIGVRSTSSMMAALETAAGRAGRRLKVSYSVSSPEAARTLVREGMGVSIQPECMVSRDDRARLGVVAISEDWAERRFLIALREGTARPRAVRLLLEQLTGAERIEDAIAPAAGTARLLK